MSVCVCVWCVGSGEGFWATLHSQMLFPVSCFLGNVGPAFYLSHLLFLSRLFLLYTEYHLAYRALSDSRVKLFCETVFDAPLTTRERMENIL